MSSPTRGPSWGHSSVVLGTTVSFLEPFRGHLSPKIDKVSEKLTLRYPHEGPCVAHDSSREGSIQTADSQGFLKKPDHDNPGFAVGNTEGPQSASDGQGDGLSGSQRPKNRYRKDCREHTTLEVNQGRILSRSPIGANRFWWHLYKKLTRETIHLSLGCV